MPQAPIFVYSFAWHLSTSDAFRDLVVNPLSRFAQVVHRPWTSSEDADRDGGRFLVFCQVLPPLDWITRRAAALTWIPMWDDVACHSGHWWASLPRTLRVVAFSDSVFERASKAGLPCVRLRYFRQPNERNPVAWDRGRVLLYWNRRGIVSPRFLELFCKRLSVDVLLYRNELDPGADPRGGFELPPYLGRTMVRRVPRVESRREFWDLTDAANIVIAPRLYEGVGMNALEGLTRGCAVFANDGPAMNEYIEHRRNGYLFKPRSIGLRAVRKLQSLSARAGMLRAREFIRGVDEIQDWNEIERLDLAELGLAARRSAAAGHAQWLKSIPEFARFVQEERS